MIKGLETVQREEWAGDGEGAGRREARSGLRPWQAGCHIGRLPCERPAAFDADGEASMLPLDFNLQAAYREDPLEITIQPHLVYFLKHCMPTRRVGTQPTPLPALEVVRAAAREIDSSCLFEAPQADSESFESDAVLLDLERDVPSKLSAKDLGGLDGARDGAGE